MKPARNLWPIGIIAVCALFVTGTVGVIVLACTQKVDLVSPDYYEQEIKFQRQIDRVERTRRTAPQASIAYDPASQSITFSLPPDHARRSVTGRIELYRPSASSLDRAVTLQPDASGLHRLDAAALAPGLWKVRVSWTLDNQDYFLDQQVVIVSKAS